MLGPLIYHPLHWHQIKRDFQILLLVHKLGMAGLFTLCENPLPTPPLRHLPHPALHLFLILFPAASQRAVLLLGPHSDGVVVFFAAFVILEILFCIIRLCFVVGWIWLAHEWKIAVRLFDSSNWRMDRKMCLRTQSRIIPLERTSSWLHRVYVIEYAFSLEKKMSVTQRRIKRSTINVQTV